VIAAEDERNLALSDRFFYRQAQAPARFGYLGKVAGMRRPFLGRFALRDREIALVLHLVA
jgi:hypothetical protein